MSNGFAANSILLVGEGNSHEFDRIHAIHVMQRCVRASVLDAVDREGDVTQKEGLGAGFSVLGVSVFGWAHEPEEGDNAQVNAVRVECAKDGVFRVKGFRECSEDGDVDRVDPCGRGVFIAESLGKISE